MKPNTYRVGSLLFEKFDNTHYRAFYSLNEPIFATLNQLKEMGAVLVENKCICKKLPHDYIAVHVNCPKHGKHPDYKLESKQIEKLGESVISDPMIDSRRVILEKINEIIDHLQKG